MSMKFAWRLLVLALAAVLLAGCGRSHVVRRASADAGPVTVSKPKYGVTTTVQRGQNLYRIATDNGITLRDLAAWNGIRPPYTIHPGQRLRLSPGGGTASSAPRRSGDAAPASRPRAPAPSPKPAPAPPKAPFAWQWPADGALLSRFVAGEPTRQGIDIGGPEGAPVRAAADGVVVYSGSGLVGYGELVIVKHNDQWLTAYGHNRARLVNEGAVVKAGQPIAELGHSGAARDMLHFEVRYNGKPVDPLLYLPKR
ncbi:MAG TPA: peptidoglycan DD-metalloendopeptidase family protein [Luteimonas sp.]